MSKDTKRLARAINIGIKQMLQQSKGYSSGAVNQTIKEAPELFWILPKQRTTNRRNFLWRDVLLHVPEAQAKRNKLLKKKKEKVCSVDLVAAEAADKSERDSTMNYDQGVEGLRSVDESGLLWNGQGKQGSLEATRPLLPLNI